MKELVQKFCKMDCLLEHEFLKCIEKYKNIITRKSQTKEGKDAKVKAWVGIKKELEERSGGKEFNIPQLQKKWSNIQSRIKDKIRKGRKIGGGPAPIFTENDCLTQKILGEK